MLKNNIPKTWNSLLEGHLKSKSFQGLSAFVEDSYRKETIYPPKSQIFDALKLCPPEKVKVVILGQDPYHGENQAHGLSFSIPKDQMKIPPSLRNIKKEVVQTTNSSMPEHGNLEGWARQGVLLLNTVLTVAATKAGSHQKKGWEQFTDFLIESLGRESQHLVFLLWGSAAHKKELILKQEKHLILKSVHPSPLSAHRGFFGQDHFNKANKYLESHGLDPIHWSSP